MKILILLALLAGGVLSIAGAVFCGLCARDADGDEDAQP